MGCKSCKSNTRRSTVQSTVTIPEKWDSSPWISRSVVKSCTFENLTEATTIDRSKLDAVTLREPLRDEEVNSNGKCKCSCDDKNNGSHIKSSKVGDSTVTESRLARCKVQASSFNGVKRAKWCKVHGSFLTNVQSSKRCAIDDSVLQNAKALKWSTIESSNVSECAKIKRSTVQASSVKNSIVDHSNITGCKVDNCVLHRTSFEGMILENGIWKHGNLIGRVDETKQVIVRPIDGKTAGTKSENSIINIAVEENTASSNRPNIPVTINGGQVPAYRADPKLAPGDSDSSDSSESEEEKERDFKVGNDTKMPPPPYKE